MRGGTIGQSDLLMIKILSRYSTRDELRSTHDFKAEGIITQSAKHLFPGWLGAGPR